MRATDWRVWQLASTVLLGAGILLLVFGADAGWWALIASGVTFAVELALKRRER